MFRKLLICYNAIIGGLFFDSRKKEINILNSITDDPYQVIQKDINSAFSWFEFKDERDKLFFFSSQLTYINSSRF